MVMMAGKLMNAVQYSGYGGGAQALKHVQVPIPEPKVDEVLIKVEAATLNPVDWKIQKGALRPFLPRNFPTIPGTDIAGEVVQVGSHVNKFKAGDKVVATVMVANSGALTEYAIAKVSLTAARPQEVSAPSGAGLFSSSLTAYQALTRSANIKLDKTGEKTINILVTAASGGVGHYVVQLAKLGNTHITATCGARNLDFVRSLGADEVLDYKTPEGAALRSPSGKKYDFVIHCTSGIKWEIFEPNLSETGKVIDLTPSLSGMLTFAINKLTFSKKQLVPMILNPNAEDLEYVLDLVKGGKVKTMIDSKYSLSKAEDAWDRIISGHATGKIILVP